MITPKFKHDCDKCKFVGRLDGKDCYVHVTASAPVRAHDPHECRTMYTLIMRDGDDGPDYISTSFFEGLDWRSNYPVWEIVWRMFDDR